MTQISIHTPVKGVTFQKGDNMKVDTKKQIRNTCIISESKRQLDLVLNYVVNVMPNSNISVDNYDVFEVSDNEIDLSKVFHLKYVFFYIIENSIFFGINYQMVKNEIEETDLLFQSEKYNENIQDIRAYQKRSKGKKSIGYFTETENNQLLKNRHKIPDFKKDVRDYNKKHHLLLVTKKLCSNPNKNTGFINEKHTFQSLVNTKCLNQNGDFRAMPKK